jgi:hypothetical protein
VPTDPVRDEAERLVAAAIAAMSIASRTFPRVGSRPGEGFATGSPECCVCPVCRTIAAMRDPTPEVAERLATGAGDLATGVASLLRALSWPGRRDDEPGGAPPAPPPTAEDPWHEATTAPPPRKPMAQKAVAKKAVAKKAVAKKAVAKAEKDPAEEPAGEPPSRGRKAAAKRAAAKKAAKKAVKKVQGPTS